jgi:chloramphenicol-sensitive protein RarD
MSRLDRLGVITAVLSYTCWGFFPIYWKLLGHLGAVEVLLHRVIWSFVFYILLLKLTSDTGIMQLFKQSRRSWWLSFVASLLLSLNWGLYIYAVNSGHVLEGSLAYFINPMMNVVIGVLFFHEALPRSLLIAVLVAGIGVLWRVVASDSLPWISIVLAITFCSYGVLKKMLKVEPRLSSVMESLVILLPAIAIAVYLRQQSLIELNARDWSLLVLSGAVTGIPLYLFSVAAQRLPYSFMGMTQFIAPSLQFLVGYFMYNEAVNTGSWISFGFIWIGAGIYLVYQFQQMAVQARELKRVNKQATRITQ